MDEVRFQQVLDEAWLSFRCQLLQAHAGDAPGPGSATKSDFQSSLASRDSHRHRVRTLTFDIDDEILRPPPSARPSLLMQPNAQPHIATIEEEFPPPPLPFEPAPRRSSVRSSRTSQRSHVSSHNHTDSVSGERSDGGLPNRTMTANTLDSHMEHTNETLKMRLGKTRGPVTGEELHDAVVALGLTRFSVQDVNLLLNRLGDFIDLQYEPLDPSKKQPKLSHSGTLMTRSSVKQHVTAHGVEVKNCKAVWKWPEEALHNRPGFQWAGRSELPSREYNAVPFRALVLACRMEQDAKRIFGSSYDLFNAIKEPPF
ncbi:unnamed protein product [Effrenium voratum]|nr:unnamed protein product [Effrenium voratum]